VYQNVQERVGEVYAGQVVALLDGGTNLLQGLHFEVPLPNVLVERFEIQHWAQISGFLGNKKEPGTKAIGERVNFFDCSFAKKRKNFFFQNGYVGRVRVRMFGRL
jgi:hypothetical protein